MLSVGTFYVCRLKGVGRIYQFTAIDIYSSFGFAYLYTDKSSKSSVDFISKVVDTYKALGITVERILTYYGREYTIHWESGYHQFEEYFKSKSIGHRPVHQSKIPLD